MNYEGLDKVDEYEFYAFIGTLYAMGVTKQNDSEVRNLWSNSSHGFMNEFTGVISGKKFIQIFK